MKIDLDFHETPGKLLQVDILTRQPSKINTELRDHKMQLKQTKSFDSFPRYEIPYKRD